MFVQAQEEAVFTYPTENLQILQNTDYTVSVDLTNLLNARDYNIRLSLDGSTITAARQDFTTSGTTTTIDWSTVTYTDIPKTLGTYELIVALVLEGAGAGEKARDTVNYEIVSAITNTPPTVSITSPANGASFETGQSVTVNSNATDSDGTVSQVEFFYNGNSIGIDNTSPYSVSFSPVALGTFDIEATATDNDGATASATPVSITINPPSGGGGGTIKPVDRTYNLLVFKGSEFDNPNSSILGRSPSNIVAYKFASSAWQQIPVQIDEITNVAVSKGYNNFKSPGGNDFDCDGQTIVAEADNWIQPFYADPNTWIGADTDPTFDSDDELVLEYNFGDEADGTLPTGTNTFLAKLLITDPLTNESGFVYLFEDLSSPDPSAGVSPKVLFNFSFSNDQGSNFYGINDFKSQYEICNGATEINTTESSTIGNNLYQIGFANRVRINLLRINASNNGLSNDFLDVIESSNHTNRAVNSYERAKGTLLTLKQGTLRTIRSLMGTSSGVYNQLDVIASEYNVKYRNPFRVHGGGGSNSTIRNYKKFTSNILSENSRFSTNKNTSPRSFTGSSTATDEEGGDEELWAFFESDLGNIATLYQSENTQGSIADYGSYFADNTNYNPASTDGGGTLAYGTNVFSDQCYDLAYTGSSCQGFTPSTIPTMINTSTDYYFESAKTQSDVVTLRSYLDNPIQMQVVSNVGEGVTDNIEIISPSNGQQFQEGESIEPVVVAADGDGLSKVDLFVNINSGGDALQQTINNPTNSEEITFSNASDLSNMVAGSYVLTARYTDGQANTAQDQVSFTVVQNQLPITSVTGIAEGDTLVTGANVSVSVSASDSDGSISRVELLVDGKIIEEKTQPPYNFFFQLASGQRQIITRATDNSNGVTSDTFNIVVIPPTPSRRTENADRLFPQIMPDPAGKGGGVLVLSPDESTAFWGNSTGIENDSIALQAVVDSSASIRQDMPTKTTEITQLQDTPNSYSRGKILEGTTGGYKHSGAIEVNTDNSLKLGSYANDAFLENKDSGDRFDIVTLDSGGNATTAKILRFEGIVNASGNSRLQVIGISTSYLNRSDYDVILSIDAPEPMSYSITNKTSSSFDIELRASDGTTPNFNSTLSIIILYF